MATLIRSPDTISPTVMSSKDCVFLAGSIEMGRALKWQQAIWEALSDIDDIIVFDPRRDDWDSTWEQSIKNENFVRQVVWEQTYLHKANIVIFYFDPKTKSPVTMLEFGQVMARTLVDPELKVFVCCPPDFWRRGNIEVLCMDIYDHVDVRDDINTMIRDIRDYLNAD